MEIGIIGGGVMGCVLGYHLSQDGHKVHIIESSSQLGGLSTWFHFHDFIWDKYYHVILKSDEHLLELINNLGLTDKLAWADTKTGFLWRQKHISMSNYWEFLTFPALNLFQKGRLAAGILYNNSVTDPKQLGNLTSEQWLIKVFGKSVYAAIWEPLLESKFGVLKSKIPAAIIWSTLKRYASTRSKGDGKEWMGHLEGGGLKVLFDKLSSDIVKNGGSLHYNKIVSKIDYTPNQKVILHTQNDRFEFDRVISTIPTMMLQKIAPHLSELYSTGPKPHHLGVIRLAIVLKKSLSPYYITNLIDKGAPYTGIIEVNQLGKPSEFANHSFVMLPRYDVPDSEWFSKEDQEIKNIFFSYLKRTWPDIDKDVVASYVHREKIVQSLWIDASPPFEIAKKTSDLGIWNVNNALAGYSTLNNNSIVEVANRTYKEWK